MKFVYCPHCGKKLTEKNIGDEGILPYCENCKTPMFDIFPVCVIVLVYDDEDKILMLKQNYLSKEHYGLVSGYIKEGETAEEAARREVFEETGIKIDNLKIKSTYFLSRKPMLMIAFTAKAKDTKLTLSDEVDEAVWQNKNKAFEISYPRESVSYAMIQNFIND